MRQLAGGCRAQLVRYGRFLANPKVTVAALLDGWGEPTAGAAGGRHVLAIQDTSEVHFRTAEKRRRGLVLQPGFNVSLGMRRCRG
jgi:hypothetical protein